MLAQIIALADGRTVGFSDYGRSDGTPVVWCHGGARWILAERRCGVVRVRFAAHQREGIERLSTNGAGQVGSSHIEQRICPS